MSLMGILDRVADATAIDKVAEPVRRAVQSTLRPQLVKDLLHGTWLGHPLHPVLAQVPVGTWLSAGLLDLVPPLRPAATTLIGAGVAPPCRPRSPARPTGRRPAPASGGWACCTPPRTPRRWGSTWGRSSRAARAGVRSVADWPGPVSASRRAPPPWAGTC